MKAALTILATLVILCVSVSMLVVRQFGWKELIPYWKGFLKGE